MTRARAWDWRLYRLLLALLAPLLAGHALWQAVGARSPRLLRERLGRFRAEAPADLWLHAASVGEVNAAAPLVEALRRAHPRLRLLVTTTTPSGAAAVVRRLPGVAHAYLPIDWPGAVRRFLRARRPRAAVILETELWPNLLREAARATVPVVIVNGRVSARTLRAPPWVRRLYADVLGRVDAVLARDPADRAAYLRLGAPPRSTECLGNLKFAGAVGAAPEPLRLGRPYVVAASTRDGEEPLLLQAWRAAETGGHLLVIVPRHPKRRRAILRTLAGTEVAVRSRGEPVTPTTSVYLADTFGELGQLLAGAELVFMGGSLVPKGGQNLLEPAALGKATVVGPHMENFRAEVDLLLAADAVRQVGSPGELTAAFSVLLADAGERRRLGEAARQAVTAHADVAARYLARLEELLPLAAGQR